MTTTATRPDTDESARPRSRGTTAVSVASGAVGAAKAVADDATARLPGMAAVARSALDDANRAIASSSDEMVRLGTAVSFGFAAGLLVGGANRVLVGATIVPLGMLGFRLLERSASSGAGATATKGADRP